MWADYHWYLWYDAANGGGFMQHWVSDRLLIDTFPLGPDPSLGDGDPDDTLQLSVGAVHAQNNTELALHQCKQHRQHAFELDVGGDRFCAGACRFSAEVENFHIGKRASHLQQCLGNVLPVV